MGKKKQGMAGGDFWDEDPDLQEQNQAEEFGAPASAAASEEPVAEPSPGPSGPVEGNLEEEFDGGGLMGALKRSKKKKDAKEAEAAEKAAAASASKEPAVQVKSKKEKEKEKKEREKAKKRAQAQRKMTAPPVVKKSASESTDATPEPGATETADAESAAATAKGKKKKLNPALAALQKQLAAKKAAEEAQAQLEEEVRQAEEAAARKEEEEEAAREEARQAKREKERKRREELKAQGKLLSKKQREQQALQARRREQLLASGVQIAAITGKHQGPKKSTSEPKKSATPPQEQDQKEPETGSHPASAPETPHVLDTQPTPSESPSESAEAGSSGQPEEEEEEEALMDDWENAMSDGEPASGNASASAQSGSGKGEATAAQPKASAPVRKPQSSGNDNDEGENTILSQSSLIDAQKRKEIEEKDKARKAKALSAASESNLRSPICAILGHVDTGKTKLLDNMRKTNVQEGEAGGITQQIGATYFPIDAIKQKTEVMSEYVTVQYNVPGLLVIDTPGHESFSNLRSRGSSLCNIAILVVDLMHGLEPQTLESIRLLKDRKTPFVVALNKIDRLYGWKSIPNNSFRDSLAQQSSSVQREFEDRLEKTKLAFAEQGFNAELYYKNKNLSKFVSLVPTSAVTGEGVPDLLYLLLELTQSRMSKQLMYLSQLEATVLEVKVIDGFGTTIDVVLSNGVLHEGDRIILCGQNGPIATNVRALLTPQPMRELRIKGQYVHHKSVKAALGVKIAAEGLQEAVAGSRLLSVGPDDDEEDLMNDVMDDVASLLDHVDKTGQGVCVQASTLGSLEALLDFLKDMKIPVVSINIGPVFKRDVMKAVTMVDKNKEFAVMLCFDVPIDKDAERYANEQGIRIFSANIIYHLFDEFTEYQRQLLEQRRKDNIHEAVFPCVLHTIQVINKRNPMIIGVDIVEGSVRIGTPIAIVKQDPTTKERVVYNLGRIQSLEVDHKPKDTIRKGQANAGVAMRLDAGTAGNLPTWGRQIDESDNLYSLISRKSIDVLKDPAFRDDVPRDDWLLIKKLKTVFDIK